jgi:chromosome segregation ATPase
VVKALEAERDRLQADLGEAREHRDRLLTLQWSERAQSARASEAVQAEHEAHLKVLARERDGLTRALADAERCLEALTQEAARASRQAAAGAAMESAAHAADARCGYLLEELTTARIAWRQADSERRALASELATVRSQLDAMAQGLAADQSDLRRLRQTLMETLCDADLRCKILTEKRTSTLQDFDAWRERARVGAGEPEDPREAERRYPLLPLDFGRADERFAG